MTEPAVLIRPIDAAEARARLDELAEILHASVHAGGSVGFILPHPIDEARAFWAAKVLPALEAGGQTLIIAERAGRLVGTVILDHDGMPNQRHKGDVRKLLVHPDHRRCGLARRLMDALLTEARRRTLSLLTLDTRTGDPAEALYQSLGFETTGIIPFFCRDNFTDRLDPTTIMWKRLG
jgi:hypothetical protein